MWLHFVIRWATLDETYDCRFLKKGFQAPAATDRPTPGPTKAPPPQPSNHLYSILGAVFGCAVLCGLLLLAAFCIYKRYIKNHPPFRVWEVSFLTC